MDYCSLERLHRIFHYKKPHHHHYIEHTYYIYNNFNSSRYTFLRPNDR